MSGPSRPQDHGRPRTASASVAVRDLLQGPDRELSVVVAYPAAIHLADPVSGRIQLAVVTRDAVAHPHAIMLTEPRRSAPFGTVRVGQQFRCGQGRLRTPDGDRIEVTRWWEPRPSLGRVDSTRLRDHSRRVRGPLVAATVPLDDVEVTRLATLVRAIGEQDPARAAQAAHGLLGLGAGSTPTGDDLLAGLLAGIALLAPAVEAHTGAPDRATLALVADLAAEVVDASDTATTALSAVLLRHAVAGEISRPAARLLVALTRESPRDALAAALTELLTVGSLSGRDVAYGLLAAVDVVVGPDPGRPDTHDTAALLASTGSP